MPNIAALLKSEIARLSRKEIRRELQPLRRAASSYRREIAALKRSVAALDRRAKMLVKTNRAQQTSVSEAKPTRFVAKGFASLRKRLDLSAAELAQLLGVSMQSVYNWEHKKSAPRKEQVAAIAALRSIGKREARRRLEEPPKRMERRSVRARRGRTK
jgi:DNA-binding transcriptional regulator YiaG